MEEPEDEDRLASAEPSDEEAVAAVPPKVRAGAALPKVREVMIESQRRLDEIHRLRGRYLSVMSSLEGYLTSAIANYFGMAPSHPDRTRFRAWVLGCLRMGDKIAIVNEMITEMKVADELGSFVLKLRSANDSMRNVFAHSAVDIDLDSEDALADTPINWHSIRDGRKGRVAESIDIEQLAEALREVEALYSDVIILFGAVAARGAGDSPVHAIEKF